MSNHDNDRRTTLTSLINFMPMHELLECPRPDPLVKGFIREQEAVCVYSEANAGKSFVVLDIAMCVATGKPWLDTYAVKQGPVIYMAGEGGASLQDRANAWMRYHKIPEVFGMYFQTRPLPLREEETIEEIQKRLKRFQEKLRGRDKADLQPRLIVVDTLSQFMMGGDENGPDMALFVSNCRRLSQDNNTAILIVHHTNKNGESERGHTALRGNVDVMFKCKPHYQDNKLAGLDIINDKQRDIARAARVNVKFKTILIGKDEDGDDISSLVPVPTVEAPSKLPKLRPSLLKVLEAMLNVENEKTERVVNKDVERRLGMLKGTLHRNLDELARLKCVKHGDGNSRLTTLGRTVLDEAGIEREPEEADEE